MAVKKPKNESPNPLLIKKLKQQRRSLGLIQFKSKDDRNITKWINLTENLVINCFGEKSNQYEQFTALVGHLVDKRNLLDSGYYDIIPEEFKIKTKDLLTNFIEELELIKDYHSPKTPSSIIAPRIKIETKQVVIQRVEINQTIETILKNIKETEPDKEKIKEAEKQLNELKEEMKKDSPQWSVIKKILIWLLNFSRDAFLQIIPILIEKYTK